MKSMEPRFRSATSARRPPLPAAALKIAIVGGGCVGLVSAACFAQLGHVVVAVDADRERVARLSRGDVPLHEKDLGNMVVALIGVGRLSFTNDVAQALRDVDLVFVAVGTPTRVDGSTDTRALDEVLRLVALSVQEPCVVVIKSTVPVGTAQALQARLNGACVAGDRPVRVLSNPEFLREGSAVADFMAPERIVIGDDDAAPAARQVLMDAYAPLVAAGVPVLTMDTRSAELSKLVANAALAMRISFVNEIASIASATGADIERVCEGIGSDRRIGREFLSAGVGYGGPGLPQDIAALRETARRHNLRSDLLLATERVNDRQRCWAFNELQRDMGSRSRLRHLRIAVWGLAFKPGTDDVRAAPAFLLIDRLLGAGVRVVVYDPVAMDNARAVLGAQRHVEWAASAAAALRGADALMLITEWPEFVVFDPTAAARALRLKTVYDGRNALDARRWAAAGVHVAQVGKSPAVVPLRTLHLTLATTSQPEGEAPAATDAGLHVAA